MLAKLVILEKGGGGGGLRSISNQGPGADFNF